MHDHRIAVSNLFENRSRRSWTWKRAHLSRTGRFATASLGRSIYLHGEIKYWLPIAGDRGFAGDILKSGIGISSIWRETDRTAWMPTFEMQSHSFLFGSQTLPSGLKERVNGTTAIDLYPGMRIALSNTPVGLCEFGVAGGITTADRDWFDSRIVFDVRWVR